MRKIFNKRKSAIVLSIQGMLLFYSLNFSNVFIPNSIISHEKFIYVNFKSLDHREYCFDIQETDSNAQMAEMFIYEEITQVHSTSDHRRLVIEPNAIWIEENRTKRRILCIDDLPQESRIAKGLALGRERFSQAILSPSDNFVAFAVEGFHGWGGLYDLNRNEIHELAFFFQGRVTQLSFSPEGRYLAIEAMGSGGFLNLTLWDVKEKKSISWNVPKSPSGLPAEVRLKEWVDDSLKISVRWMGEKVSQVWLLKILGDRVLARRLKKVVEDENT